MIKARHGRVGRAGTRGDSALVNYKGLLLTKVNNDFDQRTIFETNNQLNQLSLIYFNKIKQNIFISEL